MWGRLCRVKTCKRILVLLFVFSLSMLGLNIIQDNILATEKRDDPLFPSMGGFGESWVRLPRENLLSNLSTVPGGLHVQDEQGNKAQLCQMEDTADVRTDLQGLMDLLVDPNDRHAFAWIRLRIARLWPKWVKAIHSLAASQDMTCRKKKRILVHPGFMTKMSGFGFVESQFRGGPLGELVQWSDVITVLYVLGHKLTVTSEYEHMKAHYSRMSAPLPCNDCFHLVFSDIVGVKQQMKTYNSFRCKLRLMDSFGTEPAFNQRAYVAKHRLSSYWAGLELDTRQFFTLYPHSPDNSFGGFVVEQRDFGADVPKKENIAVVYGKSPELWRTTKGVRAYLDTVHEYLEVHATLAVGSGVENPAPAYVINHGVLNGSELQTLLRKTKVFLGFEQPFEGPAPLEAIANGAVFLNPKFDPPFNRLNSKFYREKPTFRKVTSQNPYAEVMVGGPYVHTVNILNLTQVRAALDTIMKQPPPQPYVPFEFTEGGMLQRFNAYLNHHHFCPDGSDQDDVSTDPWPPTSAVSVMLGKAGMSCADVCWSAKLLCEPSHFPAINTATALRQTGQACTNVTGLADIFHPSVHPASGTCHVQTQPLLLSCVGGDPQLQRLCPCRTFSPGQSALCLGCV